MFFVNFDVPKNPKKPRFMALFLVAAPYGAKVLQDPPFETLLPDMQKVHIAPQPKR